MKSWEITDRGTLLLTDSSNHIYIDMVLAINQKHQIFNHIARAVKEEAKDKRVNFNSIKQYFPETQPER